MSGKKNRDKGIGYRDVFTQKEYCKIIFANLISRFGDSIDAIAFTWLVYEVTGSASWSAYIGAFNMLPTILLQPFAGPVAERMDKKKVTVVSDIIRGLIVAVLASGYVAGKLNPWAMAAFTLIISSVEAFNMPAGTALIPKVLKKEYYEYGMSLNTIGGRAMELIGMGAAGIIIGTAGVGGAILIDALTFFGSAVVRMTVRVEKEEPRSGTVAGPLAGQYLTDLAEGFRYVRGRKSLLQLAFMAFLVNAMLVPFNSFQAPLVADVLGQESSLLSVIGIAVTVGMGLGSFLFPYLSKRVTVRGFIFINGLGLSVLLGMMTAGSFFKEQTSAVYIVTAAVMAGLGFFAGMLCAILGVQFLKCVEEDYLARADALFSAGATAAMPLSSVFFGMIVHYVPIRELLIACGVFCGIIFIGIRISGIRFEEEGGEDC